MGKLITLSVVCLTLTGCSWFSGNTIDLNTDVKEQLVEVLYCPAPPEITRPALPIHQMTAGQRSNDGEVAKHTKATIKVLLGYSQELEKVVDKQKEINIEYEKKKKELETPKVTTEE